TATFMIDRDQQRPLAKREDVTRKSAELARRCIVTREKNDATHGWMRKARPILHGELDAGDIEHHRAARKQGHRIRWKEVRTENAWRVFSRRAPQLPESTLSSAAPPRANRQTA